jgi:hypothetical protein
MNRSFLKYCAWLVCLTVGPSGCQSSDETVIDAEAVVAVTAATTAPTPAARPERKTAGPSSTKKEPAIAPAAIAQFTPPFPERLELFEPPKRAQGTVRRNDELGESVELKGFITVNEPRVVLSIDGVISSVPEGGEKYGVQVISIQPPTVVLQRGRDRWPATLE